MRIKLITVISLILIVAPGCQSSKPTSQTSPPMAATSCPANNPVYVSPNFQPNLGDTCLGKNDPANNAMTWQQATGATARFKVTWTVFVPAPGNSNTFPYTLAGCQAMATKCEPGLLTGHSEGTAYYEVTLDTGKVLNGRIIIRP